MSRIFDALRKAQAGRHEPASPHVAPPSPPAPVTPGATRAGPSSYSERVVEPRHGYPLTLSVPTDDDVVQQMTTLRVNLEAALPDRTPRTVVFLGPQGGEGTTTVVQQFAWTLARDRTLHTLILDANADRPSIEIDLTHRIATCRTGDPGVRPGLEAGVAINLHALPVPDERLRAGMFSPADAREMVEACASAYDWLVIDGPPVLDSSDASVLAAVADAVVLVAQAGRTKRPVLARSVELLRKAGGRVVGTVLNRRMLEIPEFIYRRL